MSLMLSQGNLRSPDPLCDPWPLPLLAAPPPLPLLAAVLAVLDLKWLTPLVRDGLMVYYSHRQDGF